MPILKGVTLAVPVFCVCAAYAQTPQQLQYCKALSSTYRNAVVSGASPMQPLEAAVIECSTNPVGAINVLERGLKQMKVELPSRG